MQKLNDLNRSLAALEPDGTLIAVIEMSLSSWLVAGIVPGVERQPLKKLVVDESALLKLLHRWREEAEKAGRRIERIAVAFEAGRDGFWLARWLKARGIEAYVIHASSVAVSREHRRAKTDRLDTELLKRSFLGWLRGERDHCKMVEIPTMKDEDAKRPNREHDSLIGERSRIDNRMKGALVRLGIRGFNPKLKRATTRLDGLRTPEGEPIPPNALAELRRDMERRRLVNNQIRQIEEERLERIEQAPCDGPHVMVRLLARVLGVGIETADMLVHEVLSRNLRDRRAIARYAGLTGSPVASEKRGEQLVTTSALLLCDRDRGLEGLFRRSGVPGFSLQQAFAAQPMKVRVGEMLLRLIRQSQPLVDLHQRPVVTTGHGFKFCKHPVEGWSAALVT